MWVASPRPLRLCFALASSPADLMFVLLVHPIEMVCWGHSGFRRELVSPLEERAGPHALNGPLFK